MARPRFGGIVRTPPILYFLVPSYHFEREGGRREDNYFLDRAGIEPRLPCYQAQEATALSIESLFLGPCCGGSSSGSTSVYGSRSLEFESHCEMGFFLLFPIPLNQWCVLYQVPRGGATLLSFNFPTKMKA